MDLGSTPERLIASCITVPANSAGSISASAPPNVPIADRHAPKTTTSRLLIVSLLADSIPNPHSLARSSGHQPLGSRFATGHTAAACAGPKLIITPNYHRCIVTRKIRHQPCQYGVDCPFAGTPIPAGVRAYLCLRRFNGDEIDGRFARFARRAPKVLV